MRVLHICPGNLYGGIERLLATLAQQAKLCPDMQPHFALCFNGPLSKELCASGAAVHIRGGVRGSRPWTVWRARRRLGRLLGQEPLDVVICHSCWPHALFAPVVSRRRLPLVFWAHGPHDGRHWLERWARRTQPDLVLANSRFTQSTVSNLFPNVPSEVLYAPVPALDVANRGVVRQRVRGALHTPLEATVIIQASRLERWKGHALLLRALGLLKEMSNCFCWIAGGPQRPCEIVYLEELQATATLMGIRHRVRFLGQCSDLPRLLAGADILCQPNTEPEPFGIVFVEALCAGLPVVTTAMGGALESVDDTCGCLVPPGDPSALADTLRKLIQDPNLRRRLGVTGPSHARRLCDPAAQIERLKLLLGTKLGDRS